MYKLISFKKISVFLLILIFLLTALPHQALAQSELSTEELDQYIKDEYKKTHMPNMSVVIADSKDILFTGNYGEKASASAPYILGSISKSFTAVAVLQLVEQGKIDTGKNAVEYLPDYFDASCKTTVVQLLNHTSGIQTNMTLDSFTSSDKTEPYEYANVNYNLLGLIVERVSGMSFGDYIKKNIFEPLGMKDSYVSLEEAKEGGIMKGHRNYFGLMLPGEFDYPETMTSGWMTLPAAYVISSVNDMAKYLQCWLGQNEEVLSKKSIETAFTDTTPVIEGYEYGYGFGISQTPELTMYVHGGNVENYTTYMVLLPDQEKAVVVLTDACDFFSANDMIVTFAENIGRKLSGIETTDLQDGAYVQTHIILDAIMLLIFAIAFLPLLFLKKWYARAKMSVFKIIALFLLHAAFPTLLLFVPTLLGSPMWVAQRFAPDLSATLLISSVLLYLTGILKVILLVFVLSAKHRAVHFPV